MPASPLNFINFPGVALDSVQSSNGEWSLDGCVKSEESNGEGSLDDCVKNEESNGLRTCEKCPKLRQTPVVLGMIGRTCTGKVRERNRE